ncbi:MAG TPA: hypothetical protein VFT74_08595 [Isosphaeraceae bacterium]|nr:hypothetical protein [Isosphaeraceae bacterium]
MSNALRRRKLFQGGTVLLFLALVPAKAPADHLMLRGGGILEGLILPESAQNKQVQVLTRSSSRPFPIAREKIVEVEPVDDALRAYLQRRISPRQSADEEYALGAWCEENGLLGPAQIHFVRAVELDPDHANAHKKLGHVLHNEKWITYDELRKLQGLTKYKGRWVSASERAEIEDREEFSAEQKSWARRLKVLRQKWLFGTENERPQAQEQLEAIRDPAAVAPLVHTFGADPEPVRERLAGFLGGIEGSEATAALTRLILSEPVLTVREATLNELSARDKAETVPLLISALKARDPRVVGRAAWALAGLRATSAIPRLIPVLVKVEQRMVMSSQPAAPAISAGFASVNPGFALPSGGAYAVGGAAGTVAPGAYMGGSIPVVTGPVVGPGVVAFGATSVPFGTFTGLSLGGGVNPNRPSVEILTQVYQNEEVLNALRSLTGVDFGYDMALWKQWLNNAYQPRPAGPVRRVPQP